MGRSPAPAASAREKRLTLVACILGSSIVYLDATVVNIALPAIEDDLGAGLAAQQWVAEAYLLTLSSLLLIGGSLGDLLGRRRVFAAGVGLFGATSLLCALAPNPETLVAGRALQGVAGALVAPSGLAVIVAVFDESERGKAIGAWTAWGGMATLIGPFGGGALIDAASWRWIFLLNLLPMAATLYLIAIGMPRVLDAREPRHIDWTGALLCALGLAGPVFALIEQPTRGWEDPLVLLPLVAGAVLFALFLVYESRAREPMMPLALFRRRNFAVANVATFTTYAGLIAASFFIVIYLQQVGGYSAVEAGLALLPITVLMFALSRRFGALADRYGPRLFLTAGPIASGAGLLLLSRADTDPAYATEVFPAMLVFGLGISLNVAPLTATVLADADEHDAGIASGISYAVARIAGLLAIAAVGAAVSAQFTSTIDERLAGRELSPAAQRAVSEAKERPLESGSRDAAGPAVSAARTDAAVEGFRTGMLLSGLLMIAGGVVSAVGIRNPRRTHAEDCPGGALYGASRELASA